MRAICYSERIAVILRRSRRIQNECVKCFFLDTLGKALSMIK